MATFGTLVNLNEVMPSRGKSASEGRDMSWLADYQSALLAVVQSGNPDTGGSMSIEPAEFKSERNRLRLAGRKLTPPVVVGMRRKNDGKDIIFWIEAGKTPAPSSYDKLKLEAEEAGISVKELKARKASESPADNGTARRGRPRKNVSEPAGELVSV